ncbi:hypothetical protein R1flu_022856 [Riccia fluitans]|uniref:Peroxidase n=1 Tax=Riccia fluitans TaxID=41844 RepID=A0ABD1XQF2_9MARC
MFGLQQQMSLCTITKVLALLLLVASADAHGYGHEYGDDDGSDTLVDFYTNDCPAARSIVQLTLKAAIQNDKGLAAALLRLHFHDCFVRGCDASVLLDSTPSNVAEKDSLANKNSIRGFETIDAIKSAVEAVCPGVVSCADILALAARDSVIEIGGPAWEVSSGRRDGLVSSSFESLVNLPPPFADLTTLVNMFAAKGLTEKEMVILSGSHTIGITHCGVIQNRLYNSTGPGGVDPTLDAAYAAKLKVQCPFGTGAGNVIPMDPKNGGAKFDSNYFSNVLANKGIFTSDAALITSSVSRAFVQVEASGPKKPFFDDFAAAMVKMSNIDVIRAPAGEVRRNCRVSN